MLYLEPKTFIIDGVEYTRYNNYIIFKQSFFHLLENKDLYLEYPTEYIDWYKYSPSFPILFVPFVYLPDAIGLFTWNLLNALVLFFALWRLPFKSDKLKLLLIGFVLIELLTSVRNAQSNGLIAGLILFAFHYLEKNRIAWATLFIVLTIFIKLFGIVAFILFILYPDKWKAALFSIFWIIFIALLPMVFLSYSQLLVQYQSWLAILQVDHRDFNGLSVAGWLYSWFGLDFKNLIVLVGTIILCLPIMNYRHFKELKFRLIFLSSILIWVVIFNHKAESPTYIIAVCGVAIWYANQTIKVENTILLCLTIVFTILSPTDLFPRSIRDEYLIPYVLKAVPCIFIWIKIIYDLLFYKPDDRTTESFRLAKY
jgi:hypothetical protein